MQQQKDSRDAFVDTLSPICYTEEVNVTSLPKGRIVSVGEPRFIFELSAVIFRISDWWRRFFMKEGTITMARKSNRGKKIRTCNGYTIYFTDVYKYAVWTKDGRCMEDRLTLAQAVSYCQEN